MKLIHCILFSLGLLSFASCIKDGYDAQVVPESGKTITFTLSNFSKESKAVATRAVTDLEENEGAVNRLEVFFYDEEGEVCIFHPSQSQQVISGGSEPKTVTITLDEEYYENNLLGKKFIVYLAANLPAGTAIDPAGKTLAELKNEAIENSDAMGFNLASAPADFLMTGETPVVTIDESQSQNIGKVTLERAAAKIAVAISNARVAEYIPTEAHVRLTTIWTRQNSAANTSTKRCSGKRAISKTL